MSQLQQAPLPLPIAATYDTTSSVVKSSSRGALTSRGSTGAALSSCTTTTTTTTTTSSSSCTIPASSPASLYADGPCGSPRRPAAAAALPYPRLLRLPFPLLTALRRVPSSGQSRTTVDAKRSNNTTTTTSTSTTPRPAAAAAAATGPSDGDAAAAKSPQSAAAAAAAAAASTPVPATVTTWWQRAKRLLSLFTVFSDDKCNSKLLALAIGQMLCSIATLIHDSYLPIYVHDELGLSTTEIGAIQGAAQFLCQLSKGVSGVVGDILGSQVRVLVFGTALTFVCKPMFAALKSVYGLAGGSVCLYWFFAAKLFDRLSKGIREAPTKAVMNELAKESGDAPDAAYGLRQSLATAGMLIGSTIASLTFAATGHNYIATFAASSVPPALALVWLAAKFRDELFGSRTTAAAATITRSPATPAPATASVTAAAAAAAAAAPTTAPKTAPATAAAAPEGPKLTPLQKAIAILTAFKPAYWQSLLVVSVLYFARFDASFLSLRAKGIMPKAMLPMMTLVNTLMQMTLTAPLARLSGHCVRNRNRLLLGGFGFMVAADAAMALPVTANTWGMLLGSALIGLHMAMTHAITISMISSYMPTGVLPGVGKLSGTAVSFTDLLLGFVLAASNGVAGLLTDKTRARGLGNTGCFMGGAVACVLSGALLLLFERFGDLGRNDLVNTRGAGAGRRGPQPAAAAAVAASMAQTAAPAPAAAAAAAVAAPAPAAVVPVTPAAEAPSVTAAAVETTGKMKPE